MKRLVALMMVGAMTFMLSGCGQEAPKPTTEPTAVTAEPAADEKGVAPAVAPESDKAVDTAPAPAQE